jgi:hypothetical protein
MIDIKFPGMRAELIQHLNELSDIDYQRRVWVLGGSEGTVVHDEFDYAVHFLYDDTKLAADPASTIGWILRNDEEAAEISKLIEAMEVVFQRYGTKLSDAEYIQLPEWVTVLAAAKKAANLIRP